jgi:hypothetical protein
LFVCENGIPLVKADGIFAFKNFGANDLSSDQSFIPLLLQSLSGEKPARGFSLSR